MYKYHSFEVLCGRYGFKRRDANLKVRQRIHLANQLGVRLIDDIAGLTYHFSSDEGYEGARKELMKQINNLKRGITQITTHPAIVSDERKELTK